MTEPNKRSIAAKARAERQKTFDPMFFHRKGSLPKANTGTPRGFQVIDDIAAKEIQSKGGIASGGNIQAYNEQRKQDLKGKDLYE